MTKWARLFELRKENIRQRETMSRDLLLENSNGFSTVRVFLPRMLIRIKHVFNGFIAVLNKS